MIYINASTSRLIIITLLVLLVFCSLNYSLAANGDNVLLFFPTEKPFGQSFGDWSNKWWSWLMSMPMDKTAMKDSTGQLCGEMQNDQNVFYLAGATPGDDVVRHCEVPFGKALLFIDGNECNHGEYKEYKNEDIKSLETCAVDGNRLGDEGYLKASFNGVPLTYLPKDNVTSGPFTINITDTFVFPFEYEGSWNTIANSYVLFLQPPPKGNHTLVIDILHKSVGNNIPYVIKYDLSIS